MHYFIKLVVEADSAEEAIECAERDANQLVELGEFDYHDMNGRWGDSEAFRVGSENGKELIKEGMEGNRRSFDRGLEAVRYMLENFTDDEIYNENFGDQTESDFYVSRYQFAAVAGETSCPRVYAMDGNIWGGKVDKDSDMEYVLNKDSDVHQLWVVGIDFHN